MGFVIQRVHEALGGPDCVLPLLPLAESVLARTQQGTPDAPHTHLVEEGDGSWVAPVLPADAQLDAWANRSAALHGNLHQLSDTHLVQGVKGIAGQDAVMRVVSQKLGLGRGGR